jgi:zinc ribbon protein
MYCPSCGKQIPEKSQFCLHCGNSISMPSQPTIESAPEPVEWEYRDFVYKWEHKQTWYRTAKYNEMQARVDIWMNYQSKIAVELQKWLDQGWSPIGEVGASGIRLNTYSQWDPTAAIVWAIFTAGVALIVAPFFRESFIEPEEFRLKMRRPMSQEALVVKAQEQSQQIIRPREGTEQKLQNNVMNDKNVIQHWGETVYLCPTCSKINHLNDSGYCWVCKTKLTKENVINNPYIGSEL